MFAFRPILAVALAWVLLAGSDIARGGVIYWLDHPLPEGFEEWCRQTPELNVRHLEDFTLLVSVEALADPMLGGAVGIETDRESPVYLVELVEPLATGPGAGEYLRANDRFALIDAVHVRFGPAHSMGHPELVRHVIPLSPPPSTLAPLSEEKQTSEIKDEIVAALDRTAYETYIRQLSGDLSFELAGSTYTVNDRYAGRPQHHIAADYIQDRFEAMGYEVLRQDFVVPSPYFFPTQNIVAVKPGTTRADEIVVIGGHYDATSIRNNPDGPAPGAEDNASGTSGVLHAAEIFASYDTERTIHFAAFGGEELGLLGAYHYVDEAAANGDNVVSALILDMISYWRYSYEVTIEGGPAWGNLMDMFEGNVIAYAPGLSPRKRYVSSGSDHVPFQQAGIPAILAIETDYSVYPRYHMTTDTFDRLKIEMGLDISRASLATLADLSTPSRSGTPVLVSGLTASWSGKDVVLRWRLSGGTSIAGIGVRRSVGDGPFREIEDGVLEALEREMVFVDRGAGRLEGGRLAYRLEAFDSDGRSELLAGEATPGPGLSHGRRLTLLPNQPNPFNPSTWIRFRLPEPGLATLEILDVTGRRVSRLIDAELPAGEHRLRWDGRDGTGRLVASGVYYSRLVHAGRVESRRMVLVE